MTTFQSVNVSMGPMDMSGEATTPTAPRAPMELPSRPAPIPAREDAGATTPTRNSFAAANGKRALPVSPFQSTFPESQLTAAEGQTDAIVGPTSQRNSMMSQDIEMTNSDDEDVSDGESIGDENGRPSKKKKKGQRFYCTDYPPCSLSFTRSEHLARHIRKHTGERPFQCHCSRRFSRLDNLRQHAQTVHVNEEIPGDSLAATGTRFQRQIRTDRVRPPGRSRASTSGASGPHGRGHSRNLSTSSIASTASTMSTMSTMSTLSQDITHRRPHSLSIADQHAQYGSLTLDTLHTPGPGGFRFGTRSPAEGGTPTSNSYANTPSSPFSSTLGSPVSRPRHSGSWAERPPSRRLSVPSGANPFLHNQPHTSFHAPFAHNPLHPTNSSLNSSNSSLMTSPTSSVYSFGPKDALASAAAAEAEWRRRTWHSSTYNNYNQTRPATSGLSFSQTPDAPRPAFAPQAVAAASQTQRLPGFETFDQISQRPLTPMNNRPGGPSEAQPVTPQRPGPYSASSDRSVPGPPDRRGHASWDLSLHQNLTKLDITSNNTPPKDSFMWPRSEPQASSHAPLNQPPSTFHAHTTRLSQPAAIASPAASLEPRPPSSSQEHGSKPHGHIATPSRAKRAGWYNGPLSASLAPASPAPAATMSHAITTPGQAQHFVQQPPQAQPPQQAQQTPQQQQPHRRRSPEDSSSSDGVPTPSSTTLEYQPSIVHPNGFVEAQNPPAPKPVTNFSHPFTTPHAYHGAQPANRLVPSPRKPDLRGLEALVAAAESESKAGTTVQQR